MPNLIVHWVCVLVALSCLTFCDPIDSGPPDSSVLGILQAKLLEWVTSSFSNYSFSSVQFSHSVMSDSLRLHESQHARPPCPSPTPGVTQTNVHRVSDAIQAISSSVVPFSSCPPPPSIRVFSNESTLRMRRPKYWSFSFSISPSKGKCKLKLR